MTMRKILERFGEVGMREMAVDWTLSRRQIADSGGPPERRKQCDKDRRISDLYDFYIINR